MNKLFIVSALFVCALFAASSARAQNTQSGAGMRAVLVVGHQEDGTSAAISEMDKIANFLRARSVKVETFYDAKADWANISKAANGANFFLYSGHGGHFGEGGTWGGLSVTDIVHGQDIEKLRFAPHALVLFQSVCGGAGSSADDEGDIGIKEAEKRVREYSSSFFKAGAGAYFAVNTTGGGLEVLQTMFTGKTLQDGYAKTCQHFYKVEFTRPFKNNLEISLASSDWGGTVTRTTYTNGKKTVEEIPSSKNYSVAFIAPANFSLQNMRANAGK